jgi:hypothetical protein
VEKIGATLTPQQKGNNLSSNGLAFDIAAKPRLATASKRRTRLDTMLRQIQYADVFNPKISLSVCFSFYDSWLAQLAPVSSSPSMKSDHSFSSETAEVVAESFALQALRTLPVTVILCKDPLGRQSVCHSQKSDLCHHQKSQHIMPERFRLTEPSRTPSTITAPPDQDIRQHAIGDRV